MEFTKEQVEALKSALIIHHIYRDELSKSGQHWETFRNIRNEKLAELGLTAEQIEGF